MTYEVHGPRGHVPMRIVARMDEPIAYLGDLMHIDGPIAQAVYRDLDEATRRTLVPLAKMQAADWCEDLTLPLSTWWCDPSEPVDDRLLKRWRTGKATERMPEAHPQLWGWCASAADESAWVARGAIEIRKRPALDQMRRYATERTANLSSGHMKAYDLAIPTVLAREVVWYAHGDPEKVGALLSTHITAIGKKLNVGNGTVRSWRVDQVDHDWSIVRDGALQRRMPAGAVDGVPGYGTIRPPYWHQRSAVACVEPAP